MNNHSITIYPRIGSGHIHSSTGSSTRNQDFSLRVIILIVLPYDAVRTIYGILTIFNELFV